jgi:hypothetical protein
VCVALLFYHNRPCRCSAKSAKVIECNLIFFPNELECRYIQDSFIMVHSILWLIATPLRLISGIVDQQTMYLIPALNIVYSLSLQVRFDLDLCKAAGQPITTWSEFFFKSVLTFDLPLNFAGR